jgi:endonuclease/exonuclease/phosphatase family metal-dependent hydrolase
MIFCRTGWHKRAARARLGLIALVTILTACGQSRATSSPTAAPTFKVLVYNVHAGKDAGGKDNLQRVADVVREADADVVLFQEVDKGTRRSGGVDQPAEYAKRTGYHVAFGRSLDYDGGQYGIAVLSRWPIRRDSAIHLPVDPPQERSGGSYEPRVAMTTVIAAPFGDLAVFNTHIDASGDDRWRLQEIRTIIQLAQSAVRSGATRVLFGGDFNSTPESAVQVQLRANGFRDSWQTCGTGEGFSYPADTARKRIDYLFVIAGVQCTSATVVNSQAYDHRPVLFTLLPMSEPGR